MTASDSFETRLDRHAGKVSDRLAALLSDEARTGEHLRPARLMAAMRHGVLNGGKRLRPFLLIESAALFDSDETAALDAAAALECIHCYSLIHDDLPAMDDDDLRRGQPTVHIAFDEATAILAGDGLLTYAFDVMSDLPKTSADTKLTLVRLLAQASGIGGMVGGQILDIEAESASPEEAGIIALQAMKTGALLRFACEAGAVLGQASPAERASLTRFGEIIGLAFQLADDLLDLTSDAATLGKAAGKDAARGKGTLVALKGESWTRQILASLVDEAEETLSDFGARAEMLLAAARFIANRDR